MATQLTREVAVAGEILALDPLDIDVGERLRPIDPDWVIGLASMIQVDGQQTPIEVCRLPGKRRWLLVSGGHRLSAFHFSIKAERPLGPIRAIVVTADAAERKLREIGENLWRRGLDPIERADFVAEMHQLLRARVGLTPDTSPQSIAANARWSARDAAGDASDTMSRAYGFTTEIAERLGLAKKSIERDLMLHRGLARSAVIRILSHPVLRNATQLRTLARLDYGTQSNVANLIADGSARNVTEALALLDTTRPDVSPEDKRLSAFIGAFSRMSLAEKKGALAQLAGMLPAGTSLGDAPKPRFPAVHEQYREEALEAIDEVRELIDGLIDDEIVNGERLSSLDDANNKLRVARLTIAGNGFEFREPQA